MAPSPSFLACDGGYDWGSMQKRATQPRLITTPPAGALFSSRSILQRVPLPRPGHFPERALTSTQPAQILNPPSRSRSSRCWKTKTRSYLALYPFRNRPPAISLSLSLYLLLISFYIARRAYH
ncbi:hypothetical protein LX32DRAFT_462429 [Colletotrichum zoysiae]|uniref:Uncharacterized protein n=1 Tax=Colletotrichum zoysiae TaxID=1216348 RepID=A0AAD9LZP0_9PEZI|nr:hypothetical protein LX32DRAFT_462429 [Colletotrichum zoysiae]